MKQPTKLLLFLCATSPALLGAKCVDYDSRYGGSVVVVDDTPPANDAAPAAFVPGKACDGPNRAQVTVNNRMFNIDCGCEETAGKVCTIPAGTTVYWQFIDSTEHNVSGSPLGTSGEKLIGSWDKAFPSPGKFKYGCSIHADMKEYYIVVK
jgi:plastocyanin